MTNNNPADIARSVGQLVPAAGVLPEGVDTPPWVPDTVKVVV